MELWRKLQWADGPKTPQNSQSLNRFERDDATAGRPIQTVLCQLSPDGTGNGTSDMARMRGAPGEVYHVFFAPEKATNILGKMINQGYS